jgi:hypothetical protein
MKCKSGLLTQDGGKYSGTEEPTSSTSRTRRFLMSTKERILKDKRLLSGRDITTPTKDGELSMLIKQRKSEPRVTMTNSDSISEDHST